MRAHVIIGLPNISTIFAETKAAHGLETVEGSRSLDVMMARHPLARDALPDR
jgi:hypothetical protein